MVNNGEIIAMVILSVMAMGILMVIVIVMVIAIVMVIVIIMEIHKSNFRMFIRKRGEFKKKYVT